MTTVAVDKFTVAADGLTTTPGGERIMTNTRKITLRPAHASRPARIFAFTGANALRAAAIDWYENGFNPKEVPTGKDADWTLIVIEADEVGAPRLSVFTDTIPFRVVLPFPQSFGTGGEYAQGALAHGATAREAVEIAAALNVYTGGEIHVENIADALGLRPLNGLDLGTTPQISGSGPRPAL